MWPRSREASSCNGYRFAKYEGESIFTIIEKSPQTATFSRFDPCRRGVAFTFDSSRCLNSHSNFTGHDDPNKPANGERVFRRIGKTGFAEYAPTKAMVASNRITTGAALAAAGDWQPPPRGGNRESQDVSGND